MRKLILFLLFLGPAWGHTVDYDVTHQQAVVVSVHLGDEEASYSEYEVFSPADKENPFQVGRSDAHGRVVFAPDAAGQWVVKAKADSQHGIHGAEITVDVDEKSTVKNFSKPLVATHTRLLIGVSLLFGIFGVVSLLRGKAQASKP